MQIYVGILIAIHLFVLFNEKNITEMKAQALSLVIFVPIYGRVLGLW